MWEHADFTTALCQNAEELLNINNKDFESFLAIHDMTPEALNDMVSSVRDWLAKQPHLPGNKLRDKQIIGFLTTRSFSVERVKLAIEDYFIARIRVPDILCDRDPLALSLAQYLKKGYSIVMPKKTQENYRVGIFRLRPDENRSLTSVLKVTFMIAEYVIWNDVTLGDRWIVDMEHFGLQEVKQATPVMISNIVFIIMACFGAKLKSVHVINVPPIAVVIVNCFKMIMKSKLADRVFITNKEDIVKLFPKECLPVEYGGEGGKCQDITDKWAKELQSEAWRKFFLEQNSVLPDISKRITSSPGDEIFGADGSFRKLCLD